MLIERDLPIISSVTFGAYEKCRKFHQFSTANNGSANLHLDRLETICLMRRRMELFVKSSWGPLDRNKFKSFSRIYSHRSDEEATGSPYTEIRVGAYLGNRRGGVMENWIALVLDCSKMRLSIQCGWTLDKKHKSYDSDDWSSVLAKWTMPQSRAFFSDPLHKALLIIQPELENALKRFKKSRYYKVLN